MRVFPPAAFPRTPVATRGICGADWRSAVCTGTFVNWLPFLHHAQLRMREGVCCLKLYHGNLGRNCESTMFLEVFFMVFSAVLCESERFPVSMTSLGLLFQAAVPESRQLLAGPHGSSPADGSSGASSMRFVTETDGPKKCECCGFLWDSMTIFDYIWRGFLWDSMAIFGFGSELCYQWPTEMIMFSRKTIQLLGVDNFEP